MKHKIGRKMTDEEKINPGHKKARDLLRVVGPAVFLLGVLFTVIGAGSLFSSMGSFEPPRFFWCVFVGFPLMFVGAVISQMAFAGAVSRYMAGESAPVAKDTFNYMADGTKEGVRDVVGAIKDGIVGDFITCPHCRESNDSDANFCNECGGTIALVKSCPKCRTKNDFDAKFCDDCGEAISK